MAGSVTLVELTEEMLRLSKLLDAGLTALRDESRKFAEADVAYRRKHAEAFLRSEGTVAEREQVAMLAALEERIGMNLADGVKVSALEAVRSRRTQLSVLQTIVNGVRVEMEFDRTGPT